MINNLINLKQLEAFVSVVDCGTFRAAAGHLKTTQPNISARIAALEAHLDVVLLHRDAGSVRLTQKGEALLPAAREVLWAAEGFVETARRTDLIEDRLRLGVTELVACTWLHEYLRQLHGLYPGVSVELTVNLSRELDREMAEGLLDIAVQTAPFEAGSDTVAALGSYAYRWVAAPEMTAGLPEGNGLARLFQTPVLMHARNTQVPNSLGERLRHEGVRADKLVYNSSLTSCLQMAVDGLGVALLPEVLTREAVEAGRLVPVDCDWLPDPLEVFVRHDRRRAPRFVRMAAKLTEAVSAPHMITISDQPERNE